MSTVPMVIALDRGSGAPLHRQIYLALRASILEQRLRPGARLPATRVLANDLGVSRTTILAAYDQLAAEGFIAALGGGGTRVAPARAATRRTTTRRTPPVEVSPFSAAIRDVYGIRPAEHDVVAATSIPRRFVPLSVGCPALDAFPVRTWRRLMSR